MDSRWKSDDLFNRLPDEIVHLIFNKLQDAQSLCMSLAVCRRFREIAPQVDGIFLPVPLKKGTGAVGGGDVPKSSVKKAVMRTLMKPFSRISKMMKSKPKEEESGGADCSSYRVPCEVLKPFEEIRRLHIRLPSQENRSKTGGESADLLKWKAEFGQDFRSCVILGAKSWRTKDATYSAAGGGGGETRVVMVDEELRLRIMWTISCLIAASARHNVIGETVRGQLAIENLVVSDDSDQGRLCMNREMLEEMRESKVKDVGTNPSSASAHRSKIPALRMKMWYLERLEVEGKVMEGATLVVIRPNVPEGKNGIGLDEIAATAAAAFRDDAEGKALGEAVGKLLVAKKCYTLEMNSF